MFTKDGKRVDNSANQAAIARIRKEDPKVIEATKNPTGKKKETKVHSSGKYDPDNVEGAYKLMRSRATIVGDCLVYAYGMDKFRDKDGYGIVGFNGHSYRVNRLTYIKWNGYVDSGIPIQILCKNKCCILERHVRVSNMGEISRSRNTENVGRKDKLPDESIRGIRNSHMSNEELGFIYDRTPELIRRIRTKSEKTRIYKGDLGN